LTADDVDDVDKNPPRNRRYPRSTGSARACGASIPRG